MTALSRSERVRKAPRGVVPRSCRGGMTLAALSTIVLSGCLIPQDVDPDSTRAHPPPRIVFDTIPSDYLLPYVTLPRATRSGCKCELQLVIPQVAIEDASVRLEVRWFVDYQPNSSATLFRQPSFLPGSLDFRLTVRVGPSINVTADSFSGDGFHAVDVVLAEEGGFKEEGTTPGPTPLRTLNPGYEAAGYRFFVDVKTDPEATECGPATLFVACPAGGG